MLMSSGWGGEALRATLFAIGFAGVAAGTELWYRRFKPPVEWTRKTLHVAFGIAAAALPWVLHSQWTLLALVVAIAVPLTWARSRGLLPSLFDVERQSHGEIYFPAGCCDRLPEAEVSFWIAIRLFGCT